MSIEKELLNYKNETIAKSLSKFFKKEDITNDIFLGIYLPTLKKIVKEHKNITLAEIKKLLYSKYHELRLIALLFLVNEYEKTQDDSYVKFYLKNLNQVNNWDLVDASASKILGRYLFNNPSKVNLLNKLIKSDIVWRRRVAIISTFYFIKQKKYDLTVKVAKKLLNDNHHYIHKATGWMLRELGKRDKKLLLEFLKNNHKKMPKLMLRYAMEKLSNNEKQLE